MLLLSVRLTGLEGHQRDDKFSQSERKMERGERYMYGLGKRMTGRNNNQTDEGGETGTERGEIVQREKKIAIIKVCFDWLMQI